MTIDKNTIIGDVLDAYPDTAEFFLEIGMQKTLLWLYLLSMTIL